MGKSCKTILIITGAACILLMVFSVVFYLVYLPIMQENNRKTLQSEKEQEQQTRETLLDNCLLSADLSYDEYMKSWDLIKDDGDIILAPDDKWEKAKQKRAEDIDICFKKYPAK